MVAQAGDRRRRPRRRSPPATPTTRCGPKTTGAQRAKYLFRIARLIQERSRELAVVETLDNGKPISESRDVDIPLAAAHFFYYAGWADKLDHAGFGRDPAAARRGRPDHPVELPAAHGRVEARPGAGRGQHVRAEAGRDHPALRAGAGRDPPAGGAAAGVVNIVTGDGSPVRRWSTTPTSTRSPSPDRPRSGG